MSGIYILGSDLTVPSLCRTNTQFVMNGIDIRLDCITAHKIRSQIENSYLGVHLMSGHMFGVYIIGDSNGIQL